MAFLGSVSMRRRALRSRGLKIGEYRQTTYNLGDESEALEILGRYVAQEILAVD